MNHGIAPRHAPRLHQETDQECTKEHAPRKNTVTHPLATPLEPSNSSKKAPPYSTSPIISGTEREKGSKISLHTPSPPSAVSFTSSLSPRTVIMLTQSCL